MQNPTKKKMIRAFNSNETKKVKWSSSYHANERRRWRRVAQNTFNNKLHKENKNKVNTQTHRKGKSSCKRISNIIGKNLNKKKIKCNVCKYRCVCVCPYVCRACVCACVRAWRWKVNRNLNFGFVYVGVAYRVAPSAVRLSLGCRRCPSLLLLLLLSGVVWLFGLFIGSPYSRI